MAGGEGKEAYEIFAVKLPSFEFEGFDALGFFGCAGGARNAGGSTEACGFGELS